MVIKELYTAKYGKKNLVTYLYIALHGHFQNKIILTVTKSLISLKYFFFFNCTKFTYNTTHCCTKQYMGTELLCYNFKYSAWQYIVLRFC